MMPTRRSFFKTAGWGAAVAASVSLPAELLAWAEPEPLRAPQAGGPILLNSNESAYGPFPSVLAMGNPFQDANRYPDRHRRVIDERLAALHKVEPDRVLSGCGSGEILRVAAQAFAGPGKKLIVASPTFEAPGVYTRVAGGEVVAVPLAANYAHDLGAMLKAAGPDTGLVYICSPNNPTANVTPRGDIEDFIGKLPRTVHVLVDEAYHDFVTGSPDYASFLDRPVDDDRLIVTRTFSKIYGMAGIRLGYAITSKPAAQRMREHSLKSAVNVFAVHCALLSLDDPAARLRAQQRNTADRDEFMKQVSIRRLTAIPSAANFVMVGANRPVGQAIDHFRQNNIEIGRPFPALDTYARISLGKPEEMKEFWRVWDQMA